MPPPGPVVRRPFIAPLPPTPRLTVVPPTAPVNTLDTYEAKAAARYVAAQQVDAGVNAYALAAPTSHTKELADLDAQLTEVAARRKRETPVSIATLQMETASITLLLALAEAASGDTRKKAIDLYLKTVADQPYLPLRRSMLLNLQASKATRTPAQEATFVRLREELTPTTPPYAEWFAGGKDTLKVRHYMHKEAWESDIAAYVNDGFKRTNNTNGTVTLTKTLDDGTHKPVKVTVECVQVESYGSDEQILTDMNRQDVQMELYTGHSSLGGNIMRALQKAPLQQVGAKLVYLGMCRGKQNIAETVNRFPQAHLLTTRDPVHDYGVQELFTGLYEVIAKRGNYADLQKKLSGDGDHVLPNNLQMQGYVDLDNDGKIDWMGTPDRLFNVEQDPRGKKIIDAVGFANTILYYHVDEAAGTPVKRAFADKAVADGWFKGEGLLRVRKDGAFYRVAVNESSKDMDPDLLSMRVVYELVRYEALQRTASPTLDDKARALLMAYEWVAYVTGPGAKAKELVKKLAAEYGWPAAITYDVLHKATEAGEYGSAEQVAAVKRAISSTDVTKIR